MKILMLSTDENIFIEGSEVWRRMIEYGSLVEELHIIIKNQNSPLRQGFAGQANLKTQNFGNVFVYPTNSYWSFFYLWDAYRISSGILRNLKLETPQESKHPAGQVRNCVITTQNPFETGLVGYLLKRKFRLPLQVQIHTDFLSPYFGQESWKNKMRVILGQWLVKKADGLRVVSERIKNSLLSLYPKPYTLNPVTVLPIFVDIEKIRNASIKTDLRYKYPDRFIILMASRLTKEKNIGLAVAAMEEIVKVYPQALLLIVGSGPEQKNLKSQISNLKLQNNIIIENWSDDLASYYKTADLFLLTSNYEGHGRPVVAATTADLPVLMTDVGIAIGSVVPVGDYKVLADKLGSIISGKLTEEEILEKQKKVLNFYRSYNDFLDQIKRSWENCFS